MFERAPGGSWRGRGRRPEDRAAEAAEESAERGAFHSVGSRGSTRSRSRVWRFAPAGARTRGTRCCPARCPGAGTSPPASCSRLGCGRCSAWSGFGRGAEGSRARASLRRGEGVTCALLVSAARGWAATKRRKQGETKKAGFPNLSVNKRVNTGGNDTQAAVRKLRASRVRRGLRLWRERVHRLVGSELLPETLTETRDEPHDDVGVCGCSQTCRRWHECRRSMQKRVR